MRISETEENYLKAIYKGSEKTKKSVSTNNISAQLNTAAASVTDMLKRLSEKGLINYARYKGVTLTEKGLRISTMLVRKHRLWEVFLVQKLKFSWDEVHEIAEQLEHIRSEALVERLDEFLDFPKYDPHGDPIPDANGQFTYRKQILLAELKPEEKGIVVGVKEHSSSFLKYLDSVQLVLGKEVELLEIFEYDKSMKIKIIGASDQLLSEKVCQNLFVQKNA